MTTIFLFFAWIGSLVVFPQMLLYGLPNNAGHLIQIGCAAKAHFLIAEWSAPVITR